MAQQTEAVDTAAESTPEGPVEVASADELIEDVSIDGMCGVY